MSTGKRAEIPLVLLFSVVLLGFCLFFSRQAYAETVPYFSFALEEESAPPDGLVRVYVRANPVPDAAAAFRMRVAYDSSVLSFVGTETSSQIKTGTLMTNSDSNPVCSIYVCKVGGKSAPVLSGNIVAFVFKVRNDADTGKTFLGAHVDQVCNYQAQQLNLNYDEDLTLQVHPEADESAKAYLTALRPLSGFLEPEFSPDEFQYRMTVGPEVSSVEFEASAGSGGTVSVNRRTLGKAGSDTQVTATVTSKNKKEKVQYSITVHRNARTETGSESSVPAAQGTEEEPTESRGGKKAGGSTATKAGGRSKTLFSAGGTPGTKQGETAGAVETQAVVQGADEKFTGNPASMRNVYIIGNQMPTYLWVLMAVILLIQLGVMLAPWLGSRAGTGRSAQNIKKESSEEKDKK